MAEANLDLSKAVCTVLGASGFIGTNLCLALVEQAHVVRGFSRRRAPSWLPGVQWRQGNIADARSLADVVRGSDVVFHLVSATVPGSPEPLLDIQENVVPMLGLLETCRTAGVRRLVFISSGGTVYGPTRHIPIREDAPTNPICSYGVGKLTCEKYLLLFHHLYGLDCRILRASNVFGPFQTAAQQGAVGAFLRREMAGEPIEIWGDGNTVRDYLYVDDLVHALILAAKQADWQRVLNVGSGTGLSVLQVADAVDALFDRPPTRIRRPARKIDVPINVLNIAAAAGLGWTPRTDFASGLKNTVKWLSGLSSTVSAALP